MPGRATQACSIVGRTRSSDCTEGRGGSCCCCRSCFCHSCPCDSFGSSGVQLQRILTLQWIGGCRHCCRSTRHFSSACYLRECCRHCKAISPIGHGSLGPFDYRQGCYCRHCGTQSCRNSTDCPVPMEECRFVGCATTRDTEEKMKRRDVPMSGPLLIARAVAALATLKKGMNYIQTTRAFLSFIA